MTGRLWVVATPIGNLEDMTLRAQRLLGSADRILCEDTRKTRTLLTALGISTQAELVRYDAHVERRDHQPVLDWLKAGEQVVLVSDAGTPGISDPGQRLVNLVREAGHVVHPVPGANALIAALSASGLGGSAFSFWGFWPRTTAAAQAMMADHGAGVHVFYCPARQLQEAASVLSEVAGVSYLVVGRELTKMHETFYTGTPAVVLEALQADAYGDKGEAVLIIQKEQQEESGEKLDRMIREALAEGTAPKTAAQLVAGALGLSRRQVYQRMLAIKDES